MSARNTGLGLPEILALVLGAFVVIFAPISAFFGGDCDNIINSAFDGLMAVVELLIPVGLLIVAVVAVWYLKWGRDTRIGESGMGTISWYTLGVGGALLLLGVVFGGVDFASIGTEQCVNGVEFIK